VVVVVTTLLTPQALPQDDLAALYRLRWQAALDLSARKSALGMDVLRGKTPEMVRQALWRYMLAYNLSRTVLAPAAASAGLLPRTLSCTGA
jgi:hypothetical protein